MSFAPLLFAILAALGVQVPIYIAYSVGLVFAFTRWNKHPKVSLLVALAYGTALLLSITLTIIQVSLPYQMPAAQVGALYSVLAICSNLIHTALTGLIIAAIFGWRSPMEPSPATNE